MQSSPLEMYSIVGAGIVIMPFSCCNRKNKSSLYYADILACVSVIAILSLIITAFCGLILAQEVSSTGLPVQWILLTKCLIH